MVAADSAIVLYTLQFAFEVIGGCLNILDRDAVDDPDGLLIANRREQWIVYPFEEPCIERLEGLAVPLYSQHQVMRKIGALLACSEKHLYKEGAGGKALKVILWVEQFPLV